MKKALECIHKLFGPIFLNSAIHAIGKKTAGKKQFFLFPSNPTGTLHELKDMLSGWMLAATKACSEWLGIEKVDENKVYDYVLGRAKQSALAAAVLLYMNLVEIILQLEDFTYKY